VKIGRERGWGSSSLMKTVSSPVEIYANGRGFCGAVSEAGRPSTYFLAWNSTLVNE
jgi:hypothetical protein